MPKVKCSPSLKLNSSDVEYAFVTQKVKFMSELNLHCVTCRVNMNISATFPIIFCFIQ
jgi:hypothetical protein